jgi:type II secretory pathway pseudopilin PulG
MKQKTRAITLIELLISIVLLSVIVLGLNSIDFFSRFQIVSSEHRVKIQNEASTALEHMAKHIAQAVGNKDKPPVVGYADNKGIRVRIDTYPEGPPAGNGQVDDGDPGDTWIAYRHEGTEIWFYPNATTSALPSGSHEVIAMYIVATSGGDPSTWGLVFDIYDPANPTLTPPPNQVDITVRARWLPEVSNPPSSQDNPEVELTNSILMPSVSIN